MGWQQFNNRDGTEVRGGKYMEQGDWREPSGKVKMFTRDHSQALAWVHAKCRNKWDTGARCVAAGLWWLWSNWDTGTDCVRAYRLSGKDGLEGKEWQWLSMKECSKKLHVRFRRERCDSLGHRLVPDCHWVLTLQDENQTSFCPWLITRCFNCQT